MTQTGYGNIEDCDYWENSSDHPVFLDGTTWPTVEHYFQAQKTTNGNFRFSIQTTRDLAIVREMVKNNLTSIRKDWNNVRKEVMKKAVRAKYLQHATARKKLLADTKDRIIGFIEKSYDTDAAILLEVTLEVMDEIKNAPAGEELLPPWLKYPDLGYNSIGWRMGSGEEYLVEWHLWFITLEPVRQQEYIQKFPATGKWEGFYSEYKE